MLRFRRATHFGSIPSAVAALSAVAVLAAPAALAQQPDQSAVSAAGPVLAEFPPDKEVCYGRVYSREHLAAHPRQKVTEIYLARLLSQDPQSELEPKSCEQIIAGNVASERESQKAFPEMSQGAAPGRTELQVYVRFKDKPGVFLGVVDCEKNKEGGFRCHIDCDGGSFSAKLEGRTLVMKPGGLRVQSGCSGDDESAPEVTIDAGDDANEFHMQPEPAASCERARAGYRPHWMASGKSLRQRFASNPSICFRRDYDEAHLKAHPKQLVKSVVLRRAAGTPESGHDFHVRFQLRDGAITGKTVHCSEETYSFHCAGDKGSFKLTRGPGKTVTLRESYYQEGTIAELLGLQKVEDDHTFRLEEADPAECR